MKQTVKCYLRAVDLGHPPRHPDKVEAELNHLLSEIRGSKEFRALKIIHGYGSHGRGGATRETVRDWAYRFQRHLRAVIYGEDYSIFDDDTQEMREECGQVDDSDLGQANPGITILWIK